MRVELAEEPAPGEQRARRRWRATPPAPSHAQPGVAEGVDEQPGAQRPDPRPGRGGRDLDREERLDPEQVRLDRRAGPHDHDPAIAPRDVADRGGRAGEEHGALRSGGVEVFESSDLRARDGELVFEPARLLRL